METAKWIWSSKKISKFHNKLRSRVMWIRLYIQLPVLFSDKHSSLWYAMTTYEHFLITKVAVYIIKIISRGGKAENFWLLGYHSKISLRKIVKMIPRINKEIIGFSLMDTRWRFHFLATRWVKRFHQGCLLEQCIRHFHPYLYHIKHIICYVSNTNLYSRNKSYSRY